MKAKKRTSKRINIEDKDIWSSKGDNSKPSQERLYSGNTEGTGANPPRASEHNFQMNRSDCNIQYILKNTVLSYDDEVVYNENEKVWYLNKDENTLSIFNCNVDDTVGISPTDTKYWSLLIVDSSILSMLQIDDADIGNDDFLKVNSEKKWFKMSMLQMLTWVKTRILKNTEITFDDDYEKNESTAVVIRDIKKLDDEISKNSKILAENVVKKGVAIDLTDVYRGLIQVSTGGGSDWDIREVATGGNSSVFTERAMRYGVGWGYKGNIVFSWTTSTAFHHSGDIIAFDNTQSRLKLLRSTRKIIPNVNELGTIDLIEKLAEYIEATALKNSKLERRILSLELKHG